MLTETVKVKLTHCIFVKLDLQYMDSQNLEVQTLVCRDKNAKKEEEKKAQYRGK